MSNKTRLTVTVISAIVFSVILSPMIIMPVGYVLTVSTGSIIGLMFTQ